MGEEVEISDKEFDKLKMEVLLEKLGDICEQLGDPGRYFASFKAKDMLTNVDCEEIKAEKLSIERTRLLMEKVIHKRGRHNEHPYDVFVGALKRMKVHVHIVRLLNTALAAKKAALISEKRAMQSYKDLSNNGFSSSCDNSPAAVDDRNLVSKGPALSNISLNSSPISSSPSLSSHGTTPPHLSSPQTDTDGSLLSPPSSIPSTSTQTSSGVLPTLPVGYNESGQRIKDAFSYSRSSSQSTPILSGEASDPVPVLPPGYDSEGKKIDDISEIVSSAKESLHPNHGHMPMESQAQVNLPIRSQTTPLAAEDSSASTINELRSLISNLRAQLKLSQDTLVQYEIEIVRLKKHNEELLMDNKKLNSANNQYQSYISVLNGASTSQTRSNGMGGMATTPSPSKYDSWSGFSATSQSRKRNTELFGNNSETKHPYSRQSEPNILSVPARPTKLPLNMKHGRVSNSQPNSYTFDPSPMNDSDGGQYHYLTRNSPGGNNSDVPQRMMHIKMTSSGDDLTSGGEDQNSVRSFESGNSGNIMLANQISTTETIV